MRRTLLLVLTTAFAINASADPINIYGAFVINPTCSASNGSINVNGIYGGMPPYTFAWNTGATTGMISGLAPGYYEVTVTDDLGASAMRSWTLYAAMGVTGGSSQDGHASCVGSTSGEVQVIESQINGTPPYTYSPSPAGTDAEGDPVFEYPGTPPGTAVSISVTDATGCTGVITSTIWAPQVDGGPNMTVTSIQGACTSGNGGAATVMNVFDGNFWTAPEYYVRDASDYTVGYGYNPGNSVNITGLVPGDYYLLRVWDEIYLAHNCDGNPYDRIDFTIPDLGPYCGGVSGKAYIDNDQDCAQDIAEVGLPYLVLEIQPGPQYAITGSDGHYAFDIVDGSYTIAQTDPTLVQLCPVITPVPFTMATNPIVIDFADSSNVPLDLRARLDASPMRPGFSGGFSGVVDNLSPQVSGPVTVTMTLDPELLYVEASPTPTVVTGNIITWDLPAFTPFGYLNISVSVQVPVGTPLGTPLFTALEVQNALPDADALNNTATLNAFVVGSYDPNEKTARTSTGMSSTQYFLDEDEWIDYTIRFQNTGTDTAFTVTITDTLATELDMASFEQGVASHPFAVSFKSGRVVEWSFDNILLPDSGTNEAGSHGLVSFRIKPMPPPLVGTVLANTANIYFDFNDPVITEPSVLVVESSLGVLVQKAAQSLWLMPNPTSGSLEVRVSDNTAAGLLQVVSVDGRVVFQQRMEGPRTVLDVAQLSRGLYTLNWHDVNGTVTTQRFVRE